MAFDESLAQRIRDALARMKSIEEKKMSGGICFPLNGNMLVGVWKDGLIVRLGPEQGDEALLESIRRRWGRLRPSLDPGKALDFPMKK
jgi:TfoX N-terminal domain